MTLSQGQEAKKKPDYYRSHRILSGVKIKLDKQFSLSTFGALYFGDGAQYLTDEATKPYAYNGWDLVPGFNYDFGEITNGISVSSGADMYILSRKLTKGFEQLIEYRPRWNLAFTRPFSFGGSLQWTSRIERENKEIYLKKRRGDDGAILKVDELTLLQSLYRYRSSLKFTSPAFTDWKITPYIYSESFSVRNNLEAFYSETEPGVSFSPIKNLNISLADNVQLVYREEQVIQNHMLCLYAFYSFDLSGLDILNK